MNSHYCSTPYKLNIKLKKLNRNRNLTKSADINRLYNNLSQSIPLITNKFCYLKNKTSALNRTSTKIPLINNNNMSYIYTNRTNFNSISRSDITSPTKSNYCNEYFYTSPKPVLKQYNKINSNNINYKYESRYKDKNNNNFKIYNNNPIKSNHYRYRSCIDMNNNNNFNKTYNYNINEDCFTFKNNNMINNNNSNNFDKELYEQQFKKLNQQIYEKDKIIEKMKGIIDDTFDKINRKNRENSLLQSEIIELKSRTNESNYNNFKNSNINENIRYNNYYNDNYNNYNNNISEKSNSNNGNKRKNINIYYRKNNGYDDYKIDNFNNRYNTNKPKKEKIDEKWEEIRNLNKKMDSLLNQNENNLKKYEKQRKKYNY